jgi:hypothetical protein
MLKSSLGGAMPNIVGGDQLDPEYAPWFYNKVTRPTERTKRFFKRKGLDLNARGYQAYKAEIISNLDESFIVGKLSFRSGFVTLLYDSNNVEQIYEVLNFRRLLIKHNIGYKPKEISQEVEEAIHEQLDKTRKLEIMVHESRAKKHETRN